MAAVSHSQAQEGVHASGLPSKLSEKNTKPPPSKWRKINPLRWKTIPPVPQEREVTREYKASLLSRVVFQWLTPLIKVGYLRQLELQDIWTVRPEKAVDALSTHFDAAWTRRLGNQQKHPLIWALYDSLKLDLLVGGICQLVGILCMVLAPYVLRYLIAFVGRAFMARIDKRPEPAIGTGLGYAFGIFGMQVLQSLAMNQALYRGMSVGGAARTILTSKIFTKAMKLPNFTRASQEPRPVATTVAKASTNNPQSNAHEAPGKEVLPWSHGRITTLVGVDVNRIEKACNMLHMLWVGPIGLAVALAVLIINMGYSALAGYALLVLGLVTITRITPLLVRFRRGTNQSTDQRVSLTHEILSNVKSVKLFGWEDGFLQRLESIRKGEIQSLERILFLRHALYVCSLSLPTLASMLAIIVFALSQHDVPPDRIFSSLALFNVLRLPIVMTNNAITEASDAWTAIKRIQDLLLAEERIDPVEWDMDMSNAIEVEDASFTWEALPRSKKTDGEPELEPSGKENAPSEKGPMCTTDDQCETGESVPFRLSGITFTARRNELLGVTGTVGSGKSSLLEALAGEMCLTAGKVKMGAKRSFCPQNAWIQNASVRDNILFGKDWDEAFYNSVIDACALRVDLENLPNGDRTEIGERGVTLSGGQRERLNLARAVYSRAGIMLIDDSLSAIDAKAGRHIMDNTICGLLQDRCRVLASHQPHILRRCDRVAVMREGCVEVIDTPDNLIRTNERFKNLILSAPQGQIDDIDQSVNSTPVAKQPKQTGSDQAASKSPVHTLMQKEKRSTGSSGWPACKAYVSATGSAPLNCAIFGLLLLCSNGLLIMTGLWITFWTSNRFPNLSMGQYIGVYAAICVGQAIVLFFFAVHVTVATSQASKTMMQQAVCKVLRAPMSFFDTTPLGRLTSRFSKDIHVLDNNLGESIRLFSSTSTSLVSQACLIVAFYPYFAAAAAPLLLLFAFIVSFYRPTAKGLRQHDALLRSAAFARLSEALTGKATIRSYNMQQVFQKSVHKAIDAVSGVYYLMAACNGWLSNRSDVVGNLMVLTVGILVVTVHVDAGPSVSGLVLSRVLIITQNLRFATRQYAEVQVNMASVERIHEYITQIDQEAPARLASVAQDWPERGRILLSNVQLRYRQGLPLALDGITLDVQAGEHIGIVGRTGAGKSSLVSALFRLIELSGGSIEIDGVNIASIGLHDLRTRLSIIPQDPVLFEGSIRTNLDPFGEYTDLELWRALQKAHLTAAEPPDGSEAGGLAPLSGSTPSPTGRIHLDTAIDEHGANFSRGQRQLMALARALLRNTRIVVCDEATSGVDFETDQKIQDTMAREFRGKTVLCIAHRLRTILRYDRVCVVEKGRVVEVDTPLALWEKSDGVFRSMCDQSGITRADIEVAGHDF